MTRPPVRVRCQIYSAISSPSATLSALGYGASRLRCGFPLRLFVGRGSHSRRSDRAAASNRGQQLTVKGSNRERLTPRIDDFINGIGHKETKSRLLDVRLNVRLPRFARNTFAAPAAVLDGRCLH